MLVGLDDSESVFFLGHPVHMTTHWIYHACEWNCSLLMEIVQFELTGEYSSALESECFNEQLRCIDFLSISCFLMRCLCVNLIFQMSILLTSCCWKKGSHWDDRGKRRKQGRKRFKILKKVHQRRKFVPFVNFLSFFESPSSINITNVNWFMYCCSLHSIWKCTCQLESYWI